MKKIKEVLRRFFLPPESAPFSRRILPYAILGILTLTVFIGGSYGWEYTNSPQFCGTTCHTMPPEYSAYLVSPHARVKCVECHIGRGPFTTLFTRKAGDLRHVFLNITKQYEYPLQAHNMRPAQDSCETCHFPAKFSSDSLQELVAYQPNEQNTIYNLYLIMKTGGGTAREGLGYGIHWHIENNIYYLPTDDLEQEIPYVRVEDVDGNQTEYVDISSGLDTAAINEEDLVKMDCITCHNRVTHRIPDPDVAISSAMDKNLMADDLPFLVREGVDLLSAEYSDQITALESMNQLAVFYSENYPDVYATRYEDILQAIAVLQDIWANSVFLDQKIDWESHPDNLGHKDDPGCFRCHDGKHLSMEGEVVRLECNLCHSIPVISTENQITTEIELVTGPEPVSHTLTTWIALHGRVKDNSCKACHSTPAGIDDLAALEGKPPVDDSFCGNEACHGNVWTYAGFNSPEMEPLLTEQLAELIAARPVLPEEPENPAEGPLTYDGSIGSMLATFCSACHGEAATAGLDVLTYDTLLAGGTSGPGVTPGDPAASEVYIRQTMETPHYFQLTDEEVQLLHDWILEGAPEN